MWVIGNCKQNPANKTQVQTLTAAIVQGLKLAPAQAVQVALAPSFVHLTTAWDTLAGSGVILACQDVGAYAVGTGAYTGDVSAQQASDIGVSMTLIGHSERRYYHHETNDILSKKISNAQAAGLEIVFCVGESKEENAVGKTLSVLDDQLAPLLTADDTHRVLVAYEPIWAIGTGMTPTLTDIEHVHRHIKSRLPGVSVLYGGSVNADNAMTFTGSAWIDGVLVGGACLNADSFLRIIHTLNAGQYKCL